MTVEMKTGPMSKNEALTEAIAIVERMRTIAENDMLIKGAPRSPGQT